MSFNVLNIFNVVNTPNLFIVLNASRFFRVTRPFIFTNFIYLRIAYYQLANFIRQYLLVQILNFLEIFASGVLLAVVMLNSIGVKS